MADRNRDNLEGDGSHSVKFREKLFFEKKSLRVCMCVCVCVCCGVGWVEDVVA